MPSAFGSVVVSTPVSMFLAVTVVLGAAAPAASVTLPVSVANVVCAWPIPMSESASAETAKMGLAFIWVLTNFELIRVIFKSDFARMRRKALLERLSARSGDSHLAPAPAVLVLFVDLAQRLQGMRWIRIKQCDDQDIDYRQWRHV